MHEFTIDGISLLRAAAGGLPWTQCPLLRLFDFFQDEAIE
jgi:hypothetical protein